MKAVKNGAGGWPTFHRLFCPSGMGSGAPSFGTESRTAVARDSFRPKGWDIKSALRPSACSLRDPVNFHPISCLFPCYFCCSFLTATAVNPFLSIINLGNSGDFGNGGTPPPVSPNITQRSPNVTQASAEGHKNEAARRKPGPLTSPVLAWRGGNSPRHTLSS